MNRKQFCVGAVSSLLGFTVAAGEANGIPKCGVHNAMQDPKRRKSKWGKTRFLILWLVEILEN